MDAQSTAERLEPHRRWVRSQYGEWVCDGVGVVVSLQGRLWLGYATDGTRMGPFRTMPQAALALEAYGT
jgi:hypothetical protein